MKLNFEVIKKHRIGLMVFVIVAGLFVYLMFMRGRTTSTASTSAVSDIPPNQAALESQSNQLNAQLQATQIQANTALSTASMQYQYQSNQSQEQYQLGLASLSTQLQGLEVQANTTDIANQLSSQTALGEAQISGQTSTNLAAISSQTQIAIGAQELAGEQSAISGNVQIAKDAMNAAENGQNDSMFGSMLGTIGMAAALL